MRRIIVCNDGTWNSPDDEDRGKVKPTNITKLSRGIKPVDSNGVSQIVFYDEGVGTGWGQKLVGGITGKGLSENILEAYRFISHNYNEGDELYLFGFSRGAYTSRSLSGFIGQAGILKKDDVFYLEHIYELYKAENSKTKIQKFIRDKKIDSFPARIKMLGVFDTVGALGIPFGGLNKVLAGLDLIEYQFHDVKLSQIVDHAYHALAVDERRVPFEPTLWSGKTAKTKEMEQRWFIGVHSNIGGGYNPDGLANLALKYMADKAQALGIELDHGYLNHFGGSFKSKLRESMTLKYRVLGEHIRPISLNDKSCQVIDESVHSRMNHNPKYKPKNIK